MLSSCIGLSWVPNTRLRNWLYERVALTVFRCFSRTFSGMSKLCLIFRVTDIHTLIKIALQHNNSVSACIKFHDTENRPKTDGICVANHTSPIDVVILSVDRPYALVGQSHPGKS